MHTNLNSISQPRNERGASLVISLVILLVMTLTGVSALQSTVLDERMMRNQKLVAEALTAAETGVRDGINRLFLNGVSDAGQETDPNWKVENLTTSGLPFGVTNAFTITHKTLLNQVVLNGDGRPLYHIQSTGVSNGVTRNVEAALSLQFAGAFESALSGCEGVRLASNARTSSYRSSGKSTLGLRGDVATLDANAPITLRSNANIKGSLNATGDIAMASNAHVLVNANSSGNIALENNASIAGNSTATKSIITLGRAEVVGNTVANTGSSVVPTQLCDPLNVAGLFSAARQLTFSEHQPNMNDANYVLDHNGSDVFSKGNYEFQDFTLNQNADVTINGNVVFYVDGDFSLLSNTSINVLPNSSLTLYANGGVTLSANTSINKGGIPANFVLYSNARSDSQSDILLNLNSNSGFFGVVYAPFAAIESRSNSQVHGAMLGKFIDMASNAEFIYDEDLSGFGPKGPPTDYNVMYWSE